jgi:hypothetical protein
VKLPYIVLGIVVIVAVLTIIKMFNNRRLPPRE